jgi:hypothetical protein
MVKSLGQKKTDSGKKIWGQPENLRFRSRLYNFLNKPNCEDFFYFLNINEPREPREPFAWPGILNEARLNSLAIFFDFN